jgi:hypothetical protein
MGNSLERRDFVAGHWKVSFWHDPAHVLVGTFAGRQPKPFGALLTHSAAVTKSGRIDPASNSIPRLLGDFELDRSPSFLLDHNGSGLDTAGHRDAVDPLER